MKLFKFSLNHNFVVQSNEVLKLKIIIALFLLAAARTSDACYDHDAGYCAERWKKYIEEIESGKETLQRGWDKVTSVPDSAMDDFISAGVTLSGVGTFRSGTYSPPSLHCCLKMTNLTEDMIDHSIKQADKLEYSANCGKIFAHAMSWKNKLEESINKENKDKFEIEARAKAYNSNLASVLFSHYCKDIPKVLSYTKEQKDSVEKLLDYLN